MNSAPRFQGGGTMIYTGYKYKYRMVVVFIAAEGCSIIVLGEPYLYLYSVNFIMLLSTMLVFLIYLASI